MRFKSASLWIALLSLAAPLSSQQHIIPLSSPLYEIVDSLYSVRGLAPAASARPWTQAEAALVLSRLDAERFSGAALALYDEAARLVYPPPPPQRIALDNLAHLDAKITTNLELYAHTNPRDYVLDTDWLYGYTERKPLLLIEAETGVGDFLAARTDIGWNYRRYVDADDTIRPLSEVLPGGVGAYTEPERVGIAVHSGQYSAPFALNIASPDQKFDQQFPKRASLVAGGEHWNAGLYRERLSWGNGHSGNFIFDDHADSTDFFRFAAFSRNFRFEWTAAFYTRDPYTSWSSEERVKIFMTHRVEFRLFDKLTLAGSENLMYYDEQYNPVNFNPALIYHNINKRGVSNAIGCLEADYAFLPGFNAYAQAVLDQATAWTEKGTSSPPAFGVLSGLEWTREAGKGLLSLSIEGAYTSPPLYRRDTLDFIRPVVYWGPDIDAVSFDFIGYSAGGDALIFQLDGVYRQSGGARFSARACFMLHGALNIYVQPDEDYDYTFPSGGIRESERRLAFTLTGNHPLPLPASLRKWLSAQAWARVDAIAQWGRLSLSETATGSSFITRRNAPSGDLQFTLGASCAF